jgi:hypothetical protein
MLLQQIYNKLSSCLLYIAVCSCTEPTPAPTPPTFDISLAGTLTTSSITEASGLAASKNFEGALFTHNDSGDKNRIFLIDTQAQLQGTWYITGATNRDWEEIATDGSSLYVADTGDNNQVYESYTIYRFPEPSNTLQININDAQTIVFKYPDGSHDCEAMLIDQKSKDIYLITKRDFPARVYRLGYPQSTQVINTATYLGELPFSSITAASMSADNQEVIMKNYSEVYYWKRATDESLFNTLKRTPFTIQYQAEPQGEGITWQNKDFYTLSEGTGAKLWKYKRK